MFNSTNLSLLANCYYYVDFEQHKGSWLVRSTTPCAVKIEKIEIEINST